MAQVRILPDTLGSKAFRDDHSVRLAYVAGAMVHGIASEAHVVRLARAGLLAYFGTGGLGIPRIASALRRIKAALPPNQPFGANFLHNILIPEQEEQLTDLLLAEGVRHIEASAFIRITPALVRYRLSGLRSGAGGRAQLRNRLMAKVSRLEVARQFLAAPSPEIVAGLRAAGRISETEAQFAATVPMADDICGEADSGGHTDRRVALTLLPALIDERARVAPGQPAAGVRIGAGGGIGTPEAVAAVFMLGADFVLTGSINQCTAEAGTSPAVKDLLAAADVQDFDMAPAGDMFEIGAKVQVLRRGTLFAGRANRLYEIYRSHSGLDAIAPNVRGEIERVYFGRSFDAVWEETTAYYNAVAPGEIEAAERNPKKKMAMVFRWYFIHTNRLALEGSRENSANFQVHSGPAIGALNRWLRGTPLEDWRNRHPEDLAERLMTAAARLLEHRLGALAGRPGDAPEALARVAAASMVRADG
jgi:trans-AT polyketide synthase/acyltransferase/oxidoreductase domain-containing protein